MTITNELLTKNRLGVKVIGANCNRNTVSPAGQGRLIIESISTSWIHADVQTDCGLKEVIMILLMQ